MAPKLYYADVSPAVRSVLLLSKAIDLELDLKPINLATGEHMTPEFLKMNPQHTVPTLEDDGFVIWDSHVINAYLVGKYAKDDSLYPQDLQKRAVIDQRLHFDSGVMFPTLFTIAMPVLRKGARTVPKDKILAAFAGYEILETLLTGRKYVSGDALSIADFHLVATVSSLNVFAPIAENRFPNICEWMALMKSLPCYKEGNQVGLDKFAAMIKGLMAQ